MHLFRKSFIKHLKYVFLNAIYGISQWENLRNKFLVNVFSKWKSIYEKCLFNDKYAVWGR